MLNNPVKVGVAFALVFCLIKYCLFLFDLDATNTGTAVLINIFLLMSSVFVGLYIQKRNDVEETNALLDIKNGMRAVMPYAVIVAFFLYAYYAWINPGYIEHQLAEASATIDKMLADPSELKKIRDNSPEFELESPEVIKAKLMEGQRSIFSPRSTSIIGLLGMLVLGTLYSVLITGVFRKLLKPR